MSSNLTFYTSLSAETTWNGKHWCAMAKSLPIYAYGDTAQEASYRLTEALDALIKTLMITGGREQVDAFMERAGITYEISDCAANEREPSTVIVPYIRPLETP